MTLTDQLREQQITFRASSGGDPPPDHDPIDLRPATAFKAITRQMVESLAEELREIKSRLNSLIFMMVGAIFSKLCRG